MFTYNFSGDGIDKNSVSLMVSNKQDDMVPTKGVHCVKIRNYHRIRLCENVTIAEGNFFVKDIAAEVVPSMKTVAEEFHQLSSQCMVHITVRYTPQQLLSS